MLGRAATLSIAIALGAVPCAAQAQVAEKLLLHAASWLLQKQIDEWDKAANDPNRPLKEYLPSNAYGAKDQFAPQEHSGYKGSFEPRAYERNADSARQEAEQAFAPAKP